MTSTTISVRLPEEVEDQLARLATQTRRTKSFLAGEAIAAYVRRELDIIEGIHRGLADMKAGRTITHDQAMAEMEAAIEEVASRKPASRRR